MKFTFRKLRNAESGAGGGAPAAAPAPSAAPAAAPAPAAAAPSAPVAGQGGGLAGTPEGSAPAPASTSGATSFDFGVDSPDFETRYNSLSDTEREQFWQNADKPQEPAQEPVEQVSEDSATEPQEKPAEAAEAPVDGETLLAPEELAALPPKVQEILKQADGELARLTEIHEQNKHVLDPKFQEELTAVLTDPVVAERLAELRGGLEGEPSYLSKAFDPKATLKNLVKEGKLDLEKIDFTIDPEGSAQQIETMAQAIFDSAIRVASIKAQYEIKQERESARRVTVLEKQFADLANSVATLKSDKPIDSPEHPINGYRSWLVDQLQSKAISFEFAEKMGPKLFATYAAEKEGGIGALVQKATVNARKKILAGVSNAAKNAAVTVPQSSASNSSTSMKHGIDGKRYLSDMAYREQAYDLALQRARDTRDETMLNDLDSLERKGTW